MSPRDEVAPDEIGPRLFLLTPGGASGEDLVPALDVALAGGGIAGVLIHAADPTAAAEVCHSHGVAWFAPDVERALSVGADGAFIDGREDIEAARERLGEARLLGASCGTSRHAAMVVGEAGADFVAFGGPDHALSKRLVDLVSWWGELFVLPCLALGRFDPNAASVLTRTGADLIAVHLNSSTSPGGLQAFRDAIRF